MIILCDNLKNTDTEEMKEIMTNNKNNIMILNYEVIENIIFYVHEIGNCYISLSDKDQFDTHCLLSIRYKNISLIPENSEFPIEYKFKVNKEGFFDMEDISAKMKSISKHHTKNLDYDRMIQRIIQKNSNFLDSLTYPKKIEEWINFLKGEMPNFIRKKI